MNYTAILDLIQKGLVVAGALYQLGQDIEPQISRLKNLVTGAQNGTITDSDLATLEADLDQRIDDFNLEI